MGLEAGNQVPLPETLVVIHAEISIGCLEVVAHVISRPTTSRSIEEEKNRSFLGLSFLLQEVVVTPDSCS